MCRSTWSVTVGVVCNLDKHSIDHRPLGTVLAVWAHPDDESFVAGGLLAAASDAGSRIVCLTATRGERGTADPDAGTRQVGADRARESSPPPKRSSASTNNDGCRSRTAPVTRSPRPRHGARRRRHRRRPARHDRHLRPRRPDRAHRPPGGLTLDVTRVGGDGMSRPPALGGDHRRHQAADGGCRARRPSLLPRLSEASPDHSVAIRLDLTGDLLDRKFSAIRAHATQSAALVHRLGEDRFRRWWATETYIDVGSSPATTDHHHTRSIGRELRRRRILIQEKLLPVPGRKYMPATAACWLMMMPDELMQVLFKINKGLSGARGELQRVIFSGPSTTVINQQRPAGLPIFIQF